MREDLDDIRSFLHANNVFHAAIGRASGNRLFDYLLSSLSSLMDATILGVDYPERRRRAVVEAHERIYQRIAARDADGAGEEMRRHIDEFARYLERYYQHVLKQPLRWDQVLQ